MAQGPQNPAPVLSLGKNLTGKKTFPFVHGLETWIPELPEKYFSNMRKEKHWNYRPQAALLQQVLTRVRMQLAEAATCVKD